MICVNRIALSSPKSKFVCVILSLSAILSSIAPPASSRAAGTGCSEMSRNLRQRKQYRIERVNGDQAVNNGKHLAWFNKLVFSCSSLGFFCFCFFCFCFVLFACLLKTTTKQAPDIAHPPKDVWISCLSPFFIVFRRSIVV